MRHLLCALGSMALVVLPIPLLGLLFRTRADRMEKSNLILILTPYIIRDSTDLRRIFERKMQERQELMDRESIFRGDKCSAPKDYSRTRGLLSDIRLARAVALQKKEAEETPPSAETVQVAQPPLQMPVPQSPAGGGARAASPAAPSPSGGGPGIPARPTVIER